MKISFWGISNVGSGEGTKTRMSAISGVLVSAPGLRISHHNMEFQFCLPHTTWLLPHAVKFFLFKYVLLWRYQSYARWIHSPAIVTASGPRHFLRSHKVLQYDDCIYPRIEEYVSSGVEVAMGEAGCKSTNRQSRISADTLLVQPTGLKICPLYIQTDYNRRVSLTGPRPTILCLSRCRLRISVARAIPLERQFGGLVPLATGEENLD
ncbi:hypothetical protein F5141DRAFT_568306 [Pisolithus sp. B1]|nr:hypothetical protein F5141DRAFT_568306 [Pisolithus sp. B1]